MRAINIVIEVLNVTQLTSARNHRLQQQKCRGVGFPCLTRSPRTPFSCFFCDRDREREMEELMCVEGSGVAGKNGEAMLGIIVGELIMYLVLFY